MVLQVAMVTAGNIICTTWLRTRISGYFFKTLKSKRKPFLCIVAVYFTPLNPMR